MKYKLLMEPTRLIDDLKSIRKESNSMTVIGLGPHQGNGTHHLLDAKTVHG